MTPTRHALIYAVDDQVAAERLHIADGVALENATLNLVCGSITIGKGTILGHRVLLLTGSHELDGDHAIAAQGRDIVIGERCWIASGAIVLGPCVIGDGAVIGAGSVVTRDCDAGWLYAGNPARKIRRVDGDD